jgi:hypothetical protein
LTFLIYLLKKEPEIKDFVETSDNPFHQCRNVVGLDNKNRKKENKFEKLRKEIEKEKDKDIKQELKKGNIVKVIENGSDY